MRQKVEKHLLDYTLARERREGRNREQSMTLYSMALVGAFWPKLHIIITLYGIILLYYYYTCIIMPKTCKQMQVFRSNWFHSHTGLSLLEIV